MPKKAFRLILEFSLVIGLMAFALQLPAFATQYLPIADKTYEIYTGSQIPTPPKDKSGQEIAKDVVLAGLRYVKLIVVVIGILFITIMGYSLIISGHNEEDVTKAKRGLIYAIVSFVIISLSEDLSKVFDMDNGKTFLGSPSEIIKRVHLFDKEVEIVLTFIKYILGAFATLMIVRSGIKMITGGGNEEETTKNKKSIMYSIGGLLLIYVGDIFINRVFYKVDKNVYTGITGVHPKINVKEGVDQIVGITNLILTFVAPIAVLMLIAGAIMYVTSNGEDEKMQKAKRVITSAAIGIILIFGAFAIVSTVIGGRLKELGALAS